MSVDLMPFTPMVDYEKTHAEFSLQMPETYNFGFDQIDVLATDDNKIAFYEVSAAGDCVHPIHSYSCETDPTVLRMHLKQPVVTPVIKRSL